MATDSSSPPSPPGCSPQVSSPRLPTSTTSGTFPWRILFLPSCSPTSWAAPKMSLPMLTPCLCKGGHSFPCSPHKVAPTHLAPTSGHVPSGQLSCQVGRRAIRVPTLGQHHVNAEGWGGEVQSVLRGSFKPGQRRNSIPAQGPLPFHARVPQSQVEVLQRS